MEIFFLGCIALVIIIILIIIYVILRLTKLISKKKLRIMKKIIIIVFIISIVFLIVFYFTRVIVRKPLNDKGVISYVENEIYNETGDTVTVKIINKERLSACLNSFFDACWDSYPVLGGYEYEIEITNSEYSDFVITGLYRSSYSYYQDNEKKVWEPMLNINSYLYERENYYQTYYEWIYDTYYGSRHYENHTLGLSGTTDIFVYLYSCQKLDEAYQVSKELLDRIKNKWISNKSSNYNVYFYTNPDAFDNQNFDMMFDNREDQLHGENLIKKYNNITKVKSTNYDKNIFLRGINDTGFENMIYVYQIGYDSYRPNKNNAPLNKEHFIDIYNIE